MCVQVCWYMYYMTKNKRCLRSCNTDTWLHSYTVSVGTHSTICRHATWLNMLPDFSNIVPSGISLNSKTKEVGRYNFATQHLREVLWTRWGRLPEPFQCFVQNNDNWASSLISLISLTYFRRMDEDSGVNMTMKLLHAIESVIMPGSEQLIVCICIRGEGQQSVGVNMNLIG